MAPNNRTLYRGLVLVLADAMLFNAIYGIITGETRAPSPIDQEGPLSIH